MKINKTKYCVLIELEDKWVLDRGRGYDTKDVFTKLNASDFNITLDVINTITREGIWEVIESTIGNKEVYFKRVGDI